MGKKIILIQLFAMAIFDMDIYKPTKDALKAIKTKINKRKHFNF